jgi:CheY-like chemotaxis protein/signal transduction histidine kinase/CHASE3 domain sensor protein
MFGLSWFNKTQLSTKMLLATIIPLILMVGLMVGSFTVIRNLEQNNKWVDHTYVVLGNATNIEKLLVDLETGQRGYLITGDAQFLEPYNQGKTMLAIKLKETRVLVNDNPAQVKKLDEVQALISEWFEKAGNREINKRKLLKTGAKDALYLQRVLAAGVGKGILDQIRQELDKLNQTFVRAHNLEAQMLVVKIAKDMVDQETGQRGFLITGDKQFLAPYHAGQKSFKQNVEALNHVVDRIYNRESMLSKIDQLKTLTQKWHQEVAIPEIKLRKKLGQNGVSHTMIAERTALSEGTAIFDQTKKVLAKMDEAFKNAKNKEGERLVLALSKNLVDKETGQRGFIITGKESFLKPYKTGVHAFEKNIKRLESLVGRAYDPHKVRRMVGHVSVLSNKWASKAAMPEINARIEMNKAKITFSDIQSMVAAGTGKDIADKIRDKLKAFSQVEQGLMLERQAREENTILLSNWVIIFGAVFVVLLSLLFSFFIISLIKKQLKKTADVANEVASGNYDVKIKLQNEEDSLGRALQEMTTKLKINEIKLEKEKNKLEEQSWIKTKQTELVEKLQGCRDLNRFASILISGLVPALDAQLGLFYFKEKRDEKVVFNLLGSYAYQKRKSVSSQFVLGEGLIGQSALEKKSILLCNAPDDYIEIVSGSGKGSPRNIVVLPIQFEGDVLAVIEMASLQRFSEIQLSMLEGFLIGLGVMVNNILSQKQTEGLLQQSQAMSEELQENQEELQASNEVLEEKTTVLKENEAELKAQSEELQSANEELEEKSERLEQQNESINLKNKEVEEARDEVEQRAKDLALASKYKSEFLANMSHELRTPLNSLLILSKELKMNKNDNLSEKQIEAASVIHQGGQDLLTLINDILDLSKVEAGKLQLDVTSINIKRFLSELQKQFAPIVNEKGLSFVLDVDEKLTECFQSDEQRLSQIMKNLFFNAVKFTESGGITIKASLAPKNLALEDQQMLSDGAIMFSVIDTGIGIEKEKQREIFEAFQQGDGATNRHYGGTGLGLAISRAMAELLDGELTLESEPGKGSSFILVLPLNFELSAQEKRSIRDNIAADEGVRVERKAKAETVSNTKSPKILEISKLKPQMFIDDDRGAIKKGDNAVLIIEDDAVFAKILLDITREKGYQCIAAGNGHSGLALAKAYQPKAIILDMGLPDVDGIKVLEQLKFDLDTRHIPVHIVSAKEESAELKQKGAVGYLMKPANQEGLNTIFEKFELVINNKIKKVLVVEDDPGNQLAIATLIDNDSLSLETALKGGEAIEKVKKNHYDCIILDLNLPDITGFELLKECKKQKIILPPIIVYTGSELTEKEHAELQEYAASIVLKGAESPERLLDEISLFLHSLEKDLPSKQKEIIEMLHSSEKLLQGRKVLIVDDDVRNIFALSSALEGYGLDVIVSANGKAAVDKLKEDEQIELVIMDIMMPVMDGYEAMKLIRQDLGLTDLPIIALTAKAMSGDREACMNAGANDYITKPVDVDKLLSMMKVWLFK